MLFSAFVLLAIVAAARGGVVESPSGYAFESAIVVTQLPVGTASEKRGPAAGGMLRADYGDGARLIIVNPDLSIEIVSQGFQSACEPDISFDGSRIVFAGKRKATDGWDIFEMDSDGSHLRQVTSGPRNFRSPGYQSSLYTLKPVGVPSEPEYHLTFVAYTGAMNEYGGSPATSLYSCKLDGSAIRRLTHNLSSDMDPFIQSNGRLLFASWQRSGLNHGLLGRVALFGVNIEGTDYAAFSTDEGKRIKHMPCTTTKGLAVFVEAERVPWDGAGTLGSVRLRRPLHSYRPITDESAGLFHSPSPLPDGTILVSRRPSDGAGTHGVCRLDPATGKYEPAFDDPDYHDIQAKIIWPHAEPDGRSSVVNEKYPNGKLYCLDVYISDLNGSAGLARGAVKRLRVIEGVPLEAPGPIGASAAKVPDVYRDAIPAPAPRRILGEIAVGEDGSFNIEIPANIPIELQTLDADGMALRKCGWIWAKNREPRGCIGCHEDGELTPENNLVDALVRPSVKLTLPPNRRRTVDFRSDIMPIITKKCVGCHNKPDASIRFTPQLSSVSASEEKNLPNRSYRNLLVATDKPDGGKYVHPGRARTSPLIWCIFGRNTSRPWDDTFSERPARQMPPGESGGLTEDEKRTFVEWIDLGAIWDNRPGPDNLLGKRDKVGGGKK